MAAQKKSLSKYNKMPVTPKENFQNLSEEFIKRMSYEQFQISRALDAMQLQLQSLTLKGHEGQGPTTLMVRQLPLHYTQKEFLEEVENRGFVGLFDFLYLPWDAKNCRNLGGYGFVNFVRPEDAMSFYHIFDGLVLEGRALAVHAARLQGCEANYLHFAATRFGEDTDFCPFFHPRLEVSVTVWGMYKKTKWHFKGCYGSRNFCYTTCKLWRNLRRNLKPRKLFRRSVVRPSAKTRLLWERVRSADSDILMSLHNFKTRTEEILPCFMNHKWFFQKETLPVLVQKTARKPTVLMENTPGRWIAGDGLWCDAWRSLCAAQRGQYLHLGMHWFMLYKKMVLIHFLGFEWYEFFLNRAIVIFGLKHVAIVFLIFIFLFGLRCWMPQHFKMAQKLTRSQVRMLRAASWAPWSFALPPCRRGWFWCWDTPAVEPSEAPPRPIWPPWALGRSPPPLDFRHFGC